MTTYAELFAIAETFTPRTSSEEIKPLLRAAVAVDPFDRSRLFTYAAQRLKVHAGELLGFYKMVVGSTAEELNIDWTVDGDENHILTMNGQPILSSPHSKVLDLLWQHPGYLVQIHEIFNDKDSR